MKQRDKKGKDLKFVATRIEEELHKKLKETAFFLDVSMAKIMEDALRKYIKESAKKINKIAN